MIISNDNLAENTNTIRPNPQQLRASKGSKVCLFCITSTRSGIGDEFLSLANNFQGNAVVVKGLPFDTEEFAIQNDRIHTAPFSISSPYSYFNIDAWQKLLRFLHRHQVTHIFFYSTSPVNALVTRFYRNATYSFWCHDPTPHPGEPLKVLIPKELDLRFLLSSKKCIQVFVANRHLKDLLINKRKVDSKIIKNMPLPYGNEIVRHCKYVKPINRTYDLIFWGRIEQYKGLNVLGLALERLSQDKVNPRVLIMGRGPINRYLSKKLIKQPNIHIRNSYITNTELAKGLCQSRTAIFPYMSATGTATIQASLVAGCRIIASDVGGFSELIDLDNEKAGQIIPPADPEALIQAIIKEMNIIHNTSRQAQLALDKYSPQTWANEIERSITESCRSTKS